MYYYKIYGLKVQSDLELEEVYPVSSECVENPDVIIQKGLIVDETLVEEGICLAVYNRSKAIIFLNHTGKVLLENGNRITYSLQDGADAQLLKEAILGDGFGQITFQRGEFMVHGSAVYWKNHAIMVSGRSGAGKSTLAINLRKQGAEFMADDSVSLRIINDVVYAYPGYPQQKLCRDAALNFGYDIDSLISISEERDKFAVRLADNYHNEIEKAEFLVIVEPDDVDEVSLMEIMGSEKIKYFLKSSYVYKVYQNLHLSAREMQNCICMANQIRILKITRPRNVMTTERQIEMLVEYMNKT